MKRGTKRGFSWYGSCTTVVTRTERPARGSKYQTERETDGNHRPLPPPPILSGAGPQTPPLDTDVREHETRKESSHRHDRGGRRPAETRAPSHLSPRPSTVDVLATSSSSPGSRDRDPSSGSLRRTTDGPDDPGSPPASLLRLHRPRHTTLRRSKEATDTTRRRATPLTKE